MTSPCKFTLRFDDVQGRPQALEFALGQKCPDEVEFVMNRAGAFAPQVLSK